MNIISYKTPQQFLDATEKLLEHKELENNLILGICNGFTDKTKEHDHCVFINYIHDNQIQATSIKTIPKAIVSGPTMNVEPIKALADYYLDHHINLTGVIGQSFYAKIFSKFYGKQEVDQRTLIVHQLTTVNNLPVSPGHFVKASYDDIPTLIEWTVAFEEEAGLFPKKTREQIIEQARSLIDASQYFKWVTEGEMVSIVAIVRHTKNAGILGLVYTPENRRGKGYATSAVQKISELILQKGFMYCGLFTDKSNPTSNSIYKKIGYNPITEFSDIEFEA